jgi:uncharacterized protein (TIGR03437 family)
MILSGLAPALVWAYSTGPDAGHSGVPGEPGTCAVCHTQSGAKLSGSVGVKFPGGLTYTPGVAQQLVVTVADPAQKRWGFQLTARPSALPSTVAGSFTPGSDGFTQLVCVPADLDSGHELYGIGCSGSAANPLQYIEHTSSGTRRGQTGSADFAFTWTPPAAAVGNITIYVAGNAANGDGTDNGDHIYTATYTLTQGSAPNQPVLTSGGVVPIFSNSTTIEPGSWGSIFGSNLASGTSVWDGTFPTTLGGVSVEVNGKPAYLWFVSSGQINFQAPDDTHRGTVAVAVKNAGGTATSTVTLGDYGPTLSMLDGTNPAGIIPVASGGAYGNGTYDLAGPAGQFSFNTRPAKKGETVELFGTGFGPANPAIPAGQPFSGAARTASNVTIVLGGVSMSVPAYIVGAGLYQINVTIPENVGSGNQSLVATVADGSQTPAGVTLAIQ